MRLCDQMESFIRIIQPNQLLQLRAIYSNLKIPNRNSAKYEFWMCLIVTAMLPVVSNIWSADEISVSCYRNG